MTVLCYDGREKPYAIEPVQMELEQDIDLPADALTLRWLAGRIPAEFVRVTAAEGGRMLFDGTVDEQRFCADERGLAVSLKARGPAAVLLDNEAQPQVYSNLSADTLYWRHIRPYGYFYGLIGPRRVLPSFRVPKGMSEWEVLEAFALARGGERPRVDGNWIRFGLPDAREALLLSDREGRMLALEQILAREKIVSEVILRDDRGYYCTSVKNSEADARQVTRRRYRSPSSEWTSSAQLDADELIRKGMRDSYRVVVSMAGTLPVTVGQRAAVESALMTESGLIVRRVRYLVGSDGNRTELTLARETYFK